ncbi:MAG: class I SAM-dependent methyltransferase [Deltaproteobacteria bacterium]|nr:class I SAM-dependent methyltransferase [Deltaproteobacteria bacterium]
MYYEGKLDSLKDVFGVDALRLEPGRLVVEGRAYPIVEDVIVLLEPARWPASFRNKLGAVRADGDPDSSAFAEDIQFTFGEEWRRFPRILPDHEREFLQYFDLVDLSGLAGSRVCDLGCGIGRWSYFLKDLCRELVLVDFSEAIFVARRNLRSAENALYFMGDLTRLPFRRDFADFLFCLGVLHHLPTDALDEVRALARHSRELLVFLYYSLDNRPAYWRRLLAGVTSVRLLLSRIHSPPARAWITWFFTLGVYLPLIGLGHALRPFGLARQAPLFDAYQGKSVRRIRQDVYDRFFTRIEQRFSRSEIQALTDTFRETVVSENPPYWHFVCRR